MMERVASRALSELVRKRTGLSFAGPLAPNAQASMERAASRAGFTDGRLYRAAVEADDRLFDALVEEMIIGETYFYRDPGQIEAFATAVFPWSPRSETPTPALRLWSAGCSTGEEAWTLAVEAFRAGLGGNVEVLGTDVSPAALAVAKRGRYGPRSLRGPRTSLLFPYFEPRAGEWVAVDELRAAVRFIRHNLSSGAPPPGGPFDAIMCRNVLLYFDPPAVVRAWDAMRASLRDGGMLFVSPTDPSPASQSGWEPIAFPTGLAYRKAAAGVASPSASSTFATHLPRPPHPPHQAAERPAPQRDPAAASLDDVRTLANVDLAAALERTLRLLERAPDDVLLLHLQGALFLALRRAPEAVRAFERLVRLAPGEPGAHAALGFALKDAGEDAASERRFQGALSLATDRPPDTNLPFTDGFTAGGFRSLLAKLAGPSPMASQ